MEYGCIFATSIRTPEYIAEAERLGFAYAYVYDSPQVYADAWMMLALAARQTSTINLGVSVITPRLRHLVANAGALATLAALAPGRVQVTVGAGFTSAELLGKRAAPWSEVESYIKALRALIAGKEIEWEGRQIALSHHENAGIPPCPDVAIFAAAHGPKGYAVAKECADGIVTNPGHGADPVPFDGRCMVMVLGTVLDPGESLDSDRVVDAAGPGAALALHLGPIGPLAGTSEAEEYHRWLADVPESTRHLELHRAHLIGLTPKERELMTPTVITAGTTTGDPTRWEARLAEIDGSGAAAVLYQPAGRDIMREMRAFAAVAGL